MEEFYTLIYTCIFEQKIKGWRATLKRWGSDSTTIMENDSATRMERDSNITVGTVV